MMKQITLITLITLVALFSTFTFGVHAETEVQAYDVLSKDEHSERAQLKLDELAWMAGRWQWSAFLFGSQVEGLTVVSAAQHNLMLGHAHAWNDENMVVAELLSYTQRGKHIEFRVRHVNYDLHSAEPVDKPKVHPLIRVERNVYYFDGHTIVQESPDRYTLYLSVKNGDGKVFNFVIPHTRVKE